MCQIDPEPGSVDRGSIIRGSHRTGDRRGAAGIQLNQLCDELLYFTSRQSAVFAEVNHSTLESCGNVCLKNRDVADLIEVVIKAEIAAMMVSTTKSSIKERPAERKRTVLVPQGL